MFDRTSIHVKELTYDNHQCGPGILPGRIFIGTLKLIFTGYYYILLALSLAQWNTKHFLYYISFVYSLHECITVYYTRFS